jgi:hypothetical protein
LWTWKENRVKRKYHVVEADSKGPPERFEQPDETISATKYEIVLVLSASGSSLPGGSALTI